MVEGRHDPCVVLRAVPVVEAAAALAACQVLGTGLRERRREDERSGTIPPGDRRHRRGAGRALLRRMEVTGKAGEWKQKNGVPVLDAARERRVIAAKTALTDDPVRRADLAELYETIMAISRRQQRKLVREGTEDPGCAAYAEALANARTPVASPRVVYQGGPGLLQRGGRRGLLRRGGGEPRLPLVLRRVRRPGAGRGRLCRSPH